jgi:hypothetical protein
LPQSASMVDVGAWSCLQCTRRAGAQGRATVHVR